MIALLCTKASLFDPVPHVAHSVPMSAFAGLMVPRRAHAAELSHDERALAWALLIESGHIPLRTMIGTCSRDLLQTLATDTACLGTKGCFPRPLQRLGASTGE